VYITTTDNVNKKYDDVVAKGYCCYHQKINKQKSSRSEAERKWCVTLSVTEAKTKEGCKKMRVT